MNPNVNVSELEFFSALMCLALDSWHRRPDDERVPLFQFPFNDGRDLRICVVRYANEIFIGSMVLSACSFHTTAFSARGARGAF